MPSWGSLGAVDDTRNFVSASTTLTYTGLNFGSLTDPCLVVWLYWRNRTQDITSVTVDGVGAMTAAGAQEANGTTGYLKQMFVLAGVTGTHDLVIQPGLNGIGNAPVMLAWAMYQDVDQTTPLDGFAVNEGTSASANAVSSLDITSQAGDLAVVSHVLHGANTTSTETNFTERVSDNSMPFTASVTAGDGAGAATVSTSVTWGNGAVATQWIAMGGNLKAPSGGGVTLEPGAGALTATGQAPTIVLPRVMRPAAGAVSAAGFAPTLLTPRTIAAGVGQVTVTGFAPTILSGTTVSPATGDLAATGQAPTVLTPRTVRPAAGAVTVTAFAPTVLTPRVMQPALGTATLTGFAPSVVLPKVVRPAAGAASLTGLAPTFAATGNALARAQVASLLFAGYAPVIATTSDEAEYQGKYAAEHSDAVRAVAGARGFTSEHGDALSGVRGAGR